jgi:hypothetical protein
VAEPYVLQALTQLVVAGESIEILFESQHTQDARQHPETGREIAPLKASQRVPGHVDPLGQIGERHPAPEAGKAQALAKRLSVTLSLREEGACRPWHAL